MTGNQGSGLGIWRRLSRYNFSNAKISRPIIRRFVREHATSERTLVLHPEEGLESFPNHFVVSKRAEDEPDLVVDAHFKDLAGIPSESYSMLLCVGLLEHIPDPQRFVNELHRILKPEGRALLTCSACFSFHGGKDNYFHFTPGGVRLLFRDWSRFEVLRGSCGPFTTIGILIQRILLQSEIFPPLRPFLEATVHVFPRLDRFVKRQYTTNGMLEGTECDSMLPSNLQVVVVK
jgi:SAM-dependent methyltransferase